jgi:putative component of membrane protein insertase Oxa1/YidC/SpoIIIJ protein YidD
MRVTLQWESDDFSAVCARLEPSSTQDAVEFVFAASLVMEISRILRCVPMREAGRRSA